MGASTPYGISVTRRVNTPGAGVSVPDPTVHYPSMYRAIAVEVLSNRFVLDDDSIASLSSAYDVSQSDLALAPINSIIGRVITRGRDHFNKTHGVFFPLLSPHVSLPVKPGEQVWIVYEDPYASTDVGYWISRIHGPMHVDDVNYTHLSRQYVESLTLRSKRDKRSNAPPGFPNGNDIDSFDLLDDSYDRVFSQALSRQHVVIEPVPRRQKQPGDTVIQGSNNASISLCTDRNAVNQAPEASRAAVDIVAGVSSRLVDVHENKRPPDNAPPIVRNTRDDLETAKDPQDQALINRNEGDSSFTNDAARVYVTMRASSDESFDIKHPALGVSSNSQSIDAVNDSSYVVIRADQVRIVSPNGDGKGRISLIKEGSSDTRSAIVMHDDGTVQIFAKKIQLGRDENAAGGYVMFSKYNTQLTDALKSIVSSINAVTTALTTNVVTSMGSPVLFAPNAIASLQESSATLSLILNDIPSARSKAIVGE